MTTNTPQAGPLDSLFGPVGCASFHSFATTAGTSDTGTRTYQIGDR